MLPHMSQPVASQLLACQRDYLDTITMSGHSGYHQQKSAAVNLQHLQQIQIQPEETTASLCSKQLKLS